MTPNVTLVVVSSVLIATGVYLFLSRSMARALMGFLLMGNGINLIFIMGSGDAGAPPIVGSSDGATMADPVPQALVLTAIVITLAMSAFVLALTHRSWQLGRQDLVDDDTESARIHARAEADDTGDDRSAKERADEIAAEVELSESKRYAIPGDPSTPTTERAEHAIGGPGEGTDDPQDVTEAGAGSSPVQTHPGTTADPEAPDDVEAAATGQPRPGGDGETGDDDDGTGRGGDR